MEQRAKVMGKSQVASIAKKGKDAIRKRHKKTIKFINTRTEALSIQSHQEVLTTWKSISI